MSAPTWREAWVDVDLGAVAHNVATMAALVSPARLCAVVKADGYGHGAVAVAHAALSSGAAWLAVALVEEGLVLRQAGVTAPVLLLSEPPPAAMADAVALGLTPTLYTRAGVRAAAAAVVGRPGVGRQELGVHLKVDTGMHRVGADPADLPAVAHEVAASPGLRLEGLWTHLAVADDPSRAAATSAQLHLFEEVRSVLRAEGIEPPVVHAANSAGAIAHPAARYDMVRCGIALYGHAPSAALEGSVELRPAMSLRARVTMVRRLSAAEPVSYGWGYTAAAGSLVATVPLGYADGVPRRLSEVGGEVLVGGRRRPIAGTVTMDQLLVDCGPGAGAAVGDEVVLLGRQGAEEVTAGEWAGRLGTISYEILCGIGARVPRVHGWAGPR